MCPLNASFDCNFLAKRFKPKGADGVACVVVTSKNLTVFSLKPSS